jgi:hypothetical protein
MIYQNYFIAKTFNYKKKQLIKVDNFGLTMTLHFSGVYTHRRLSRDFHVGPAHHHNAQVAAAAAHSKKMGGSKRIGTLYL